MMKTKPYWVKVGAIVQFTWHGAWFNGKVLNIYRTRVRVTLPGKPARTTLRLIEELTKP